MEVKRIVNLGSYEITTKPAGFWRKVLWDILPYWQGSTPKFEIILKALADISSEHHFLITLYLHSPHAGNPQKLEKIPMENVKEGDIKRNIFTTKPLFDTGNMFLILVAYGIDIQYETTIYSFHVTNRSWLALAILAGTLAGMFAALGNIIIAIINQD